MAGWVEEFIVYIQSLVQELSASLDLGSADCIAGVAGGFVFLFVVSRLWTNTSE